MSFADPTVVLPLGRSYGESQVNEMLTWMERHALPFICTANLPDHLDSAVPRRFTLKLRFNVLDPARAALAFRRILDADLPGPLPEGLTPGDFSDVRRQAELLGETRVNRRPSGTPAIRTVSSICRADRRRNPTPNNNGRR
jgi:hypothetical protein